MKPSFLEIGVPDAGAATAFFTAFFGWSFSPMDEGGVFETGGLKTGIHGDDPNPGIAVYFQVDDIDEAVRKLHALGGQTDEPIVDEPGFGRFVSCLSPQGVRFGLHQRA